MLKRRGFLGGVLGACAAWFWLGPAFALGLGEIEVQSRLEQPLRAVIPIISADPGELESMTISLAPGEDFSRAGIERVDYLSTVSFTLDIKTGAPRILVTGKGPAREPFLDFLLEVRWSGGTLLREYTVLLDPPTMVAGAAAAAPKPAPQSQLTPEFTPQPTPPAPAAAPAPEPAPSPAEAPPAPQASEPHELPPEVEAQLLDHFGDQTGPAAAPAAGKPAAPYGGKTYGPVARGETLWRVAEKLRPDASVTMDQVMVAVYEANPGAFDGGMNGLLSGSILKVPAPDEMRAVDPVTAKARVDAIRGGKTTAAAATPSPAPEPPAPEEAAAPTVAPAEQVPPEAAPGETTAQVPPAAPAESENAAPAPETAPPAAEAPAEQIPEQPEAPPEEPSAEQPPVETAPVETAAPEAPPAPAPAPPPPQAGGLPLVPIAAALVAVLLALLGWSLWRKRRRALEEPVAPEITTRPVIGVTPFEPAADRKPVAARAATPAASPQPSAKGAGDEAELGAIEELADLERTLTTEPAGPAGKTAQETDFDVTSKFAADTVQINLDSNDPIAEADFHLAYGLYDEAALLLKQAIGKDAKRKALRIKLAETYFAAGKPAEFEATAEALKSLVDPAEWQKIAIMGRQLCPDAALFKGAGEADLSVDLALGEEIPEAPAAAETAPGKVAAESASVLDFSLEDFDTAPAPAAGPKSEPAADAGNALEFDLSEFDLAKEAEHASEGAPAPQAVPTQQSPEAPKLDLELNDFGGDFGQPASPQQPEHPSEGAPATADVDLGEFDLGDLTAGEGAIASGDETGTKLDLARAYLDMGDNEMARSLLNEVVQQGTVVQKKEAEGLLLRVPA